jgi:hypothetical protein
VLDAETATNSRIGESKNFSFLFQQQEVNTENACTKKQSRRSFF